MRANHHNNLMFWVFFCFLNLLILPHVVVCLPEAPNTFGVNEDEEKTKENNNKERKEKKVRTPVTTRSLLANNKK